MPLKNLIFVTFALIIAGGCSKFRKIEKSQDWRVKYEAALAYYDDKDYYRSSVLFEQVLPIVRGLPEGEEVQYRLAYCQYYNKYYLLAAEQFKSFYEIYGRSPYAQEARYMQAYSLYVSSPGYELDQTASKQAMALMQSFVNRFPNSEYTEKALEVIQTIQEKLEIKGFENARQYHKMGQYDAAITALENFRNNFPDSKYTEEAAYLILDSKYNYAKKSYLSLQLERYQDVVRTYERFIDTYTNSTFLKDAERLYVESLEKINSLKSNT